MAIMFLSQLKLEKARNRFSALKLFHMERMIRKKAQNEAGER